jgi:OPA family glycerol-3-phosphate transporter-like MFS transporter 1/2
MDERSSLLNSKPGAAAAAGDADNAAALSKYRTLVYSSTFVAYAMSHFSRKCYTNIKVQLKGIGVDPILLSQMDTAFMFCYAIGSFFSGKLGDTYHAPSIVALGLFGSAFCVFSLAVGIWSDIETMSYGVYYSFFMGVWLLHGFFQSTGGPVGTAIMGNWFGSKNRGWIFGTWTCHQYVGNISAALVATAILHSSLNWTLALVIPAVANVVWGVWMWTSVPEKPADVGVVRDDENLPAKTSGVRTLGGIFKHIYKTVVINVVLPLLIFLFLHCNI